MLSNLGDKPAEAELKPIRDIVPTSSVLLKYLPWIIGLLVVLGIAAAIFFIIRRRRAAKGEIESMIPAHKRARDGIERLVQEGIFEKGNVKGFYFRLTEIIRSYMENIRDFPAAEYTTEEISRYISTEEDRKILPLLRNADLVKFADKVPSAHNKENDVKEALDYIDTTRCINQ